MLSRANRLGFGTVACAIVILALFPVPAYAQLTSWFQGFETDNSGWDLPFGAQYDATRVPSGTHGVTSRTGNFHAEAFGPCGLDTPSPVPCGGSAFTDWGGYGGHPGCFMTACAAQNFPPGGYLTSVDLYLDAQNLNSQIIESNDTRFDFSSAIDDPTGNFRRDFVFNGGFYTTDQSNGTFVDVGAIPHFVISTGNNAGRGGAFPPDSGHDPIAITLSGWYTFQHRFYDSGGGVLAVDFMIFDSTGHLVHKWTRSDPSDIIGVTVGGHRYGWLASNEFNFMAIDNSFYLAAALTGVYTVDYFANANTVGAPDGILRIVNPGTTDDPSKPGKEAGPLCALIYVFDANQEMSECCGCSLTANALATFSVNTNLTANPLLGTKLKTGVIKVISSASATPCDPTSINATQTLRAWATHIQNKVSAAFPSTEGESQSAALSAGEQADLGEDCKVLEELGSGTAGVCKCPPGH